MNLYFFRKPMIFGVALCAMLIGTWAHAQNPGNHGGGQHGQPGKKPDNKPEKPQGHGHGHEGHGQAGQNHGQAGQNHGQAGQNHGQAGQNHGQAGQNHGQAGQNHGQAGQNHGQARGRLGKYDLKKEWRKHTKRIAKIERIIALAKEGANADLQATAERIRLKEMRRHAKVLKRCENERKRMKREKKKRKGHKGKGVK